MPPSSTATTSPAPDPAFSERMAKPRSPEVPVTEAMRQRILSRTAAWLGASGVTQIALFGAGRHSRPIIRQPWLAHGIRVALVLDDNPRLPSIGGVPVVRPGDVPLPADIGAIVISSECYEAQLFERASRLFGNAGIPIVRLYTSDDAAYEASATLDRLRTIEGLSDADARWLVDNRGERHDATLPMLPPARTELHLRRYELAADIMARIGAKAAADLACGTGYGASLLSPPHAPRRYVGVDIDARTIDYARARHAGADRVFHCCSAVATPIESASVDLIASFETIEHIDATQALVDEYSRVLKPRGVLVVSTPNKLGPTPFHVHDFGSVEFLAALEDRFEVVEMLGQLPLDEVYDADLPPGMWRIELAAARSGINLGPATAPATKPDFLIAVARKRGGGGQPILVPAAPDEVIVETRHGHIRFFCPNEATRWRARTLLTKEPETLEWIDRFEPGDVFWDVGASTGPYMLYAAAAGVASKIVAFDPSPWNWWVLAEQIRRSGLGDRVLAYPLAVADRAVAAPLHMRHTLCGGAGSSFGEPIGEFGERFTPVFQQAAVGVPIDELIERFGLPFPNRLKIDVDGAEERVIGGATRTLCDPRLRSVVIELDSARKDLIERITKAMTDAGLRFVARRHAEFVDSTENASIFNFEFSR